MKKWITMLLTLLLLPCLSFAETVVTSFYPIWLMALNLTQGISEVNVRNLAAPTTGCLHDYQLQMADIKALSEADIFLVNGAGMENFLLKVAGDLPDLPIIEASAGIGLLGEGEAVEIGEGEESEGNSHIWLDPSRAIRMAENLAEGLTGVFPAYAEVIAENLAGYRSRLETLDQQLREGLRNLSRREIVTFHEAFPYFAASYDLHVVAVVNKEPGETLTGSEMAELARELIRLGHPPLFVEPQYTDLSAQTLSRETGSPVYTLDPVVTGPESDVPLDYYETVMLQNMQTLLTALSDH